VLHSWNQRLAVSSAYPLCSLLAGRSGSRSFQLDLRAGRLFFLPIGRFSAASFGQVRRADFASAFHRGELQFSRRTSALAQPRAFAAWLRYCSAMTGSSTPSAHSADLNNATALISAPTLIAWLSPTPGWSLLRTATSPFAGATPRHGNKKTHDSGCR